MEFTFKDYKVSLVIDGYEFSDDGYIYDDSDKNWLLVNVTYQNRNQKIIKRDPALQVSELIELRKWFHNIYYNKPINSLNFIENTLEFIYDKEKIILELCFGLSLYDTKSADDRCCIVELNFDKFYLEDIINELDMYIDKYPMR